MSARSMLFPGRAEVLNTWRSPAFDDVVAGHESKSPECSRVTSMAVNVPQGERDTESCLQEKVLANSC